MITRRTLLTGGLAAIGAGGVPRPLRAAAAATPEATCPRPSARQLAWQREELAMFVHFSINTFTDHEWGDGHESPQLFDPERLDARQWARSARAAGFRSLILTAKHHDGFCLWPTATTSHSVRSSPWRAGRGDVVAEFVAACRAEGLGAGLYLSPWDRHEPRYGSGQAYDDFYVAQLTELLTHYGPLTEVWFDGANGEGPGGRRQAYDWPRIHDTVRRYQPGAVIFSDAGPDVRWVGNERGVAPPTCWGQVDPARVPYPGYTGLGVEEALGEGDPLGSVWRPAEADVSIRPGWFWHAAEDSRVRSGTELLDLYLKSVGRNAKLLLNVPPTRTGVLHDSDVQALEDFGRRREALLADNLLRGARVRSSSAAPGHAAEAALDSDLDSHWSAAENERSGWIEVALPEPIEFDTLSLAEAVARGQQIAGHRLEYRTTGGEWRTASWGSTIGSRRLERFPPVRARELRLRVDFAYGPPRLAAMGVYRGGAEL